MSGNTSRNKGQRGEREVIKLLQPVVNRVYEGAMRAAPCLERNLMQSHKGGHDVVGLEWLALEVKFQETLQTEAWWDQTKLQAQRIEHKEGFYVEPILFYRKSHMKWNIRMFGRLQTVPGGANIRCPVDISLGSFLVWFEHALRERVK